MGLSPSELPKRTELADIAMNDDQLEKLLARADEPPRLPVGEDFAARVRARQAAQQRARRRRLLLAAPVVVGLFALAGWQIALRESQRSGGTQIAAGPEHDQGQVARAKAELAALVAEAEFHERLARNMIDDRRRDQLLEEVRVSNAEGSAEETPREQIEIVAYRMILEADALRAAMAPDEESTAIYEKVVRLFPATDSAQAAQSRLAGGATFEHSTARRNCDATRDH